MQMCYLFMEENGATLPSGFLRDPFGISSGFVRDVASSVLKIC